MTWNLFKEKQPQQNGLYFIIPYREGREIDLILSAEWENGEWVFHHELMKNTQRYRLEVGEWREYFPTAVDSRAEDEKNEQMKLAKKIMDKNHVVLKRLDDHHAMD